MYGQCPLVREKEADPYRLPVGKQVGYRGGEVGYLLAVVQVRLRIQQRSASPRFGTQESRLFRSIDA